MITKVTQKRLKVMQFLIKTFAKGVLEYYDYGEDAILAVDRAGNKMVFRYYENDNGLSGVHGFIEYCDIDGNSRQIIDA